MTLDESGLGPQHFDVTVQWRGTAAIVTVSGELDLVTAPQLTESVELVCGKQPTALVIDLSNVGFLASAGMSLLASTHQKLGDTAGFAVVADGPATGRPLTLVGLDQLFGIFATVEEALDVLQVGKS